MQSKIKLFLTFSYLLCLYLAIHLLPIGDWISTEWLSSLVFMILYLALAGLTIVEGYRLKADIKQEGMSSRFFAPFFLVCFSNLIYGSFFLKYEMTKELSVIFIEVFSILSCALIEEFLFRVFLFEFFRSVLKDGRWKSLSIIAITSVCFSLMHTINFFGNNWIDVLIQLGYTLFLGVIFGIAAEYSSMRYLSIPLHFAYNLCNSLLFTALYPMQTYDWIYFVLSLGIGIVFSVYLIVVLICYKKKERKENVS